MTTLAIRLNTSLFFDRAAVTRSTDAKQRRVLSKAGAFVRRTARSSIRSRKRPKAGQRGRVTRPSRPGEPPISWTKPGIRDIFFQFDPQRMSVVIGPNQFNAKGDVPGILELGGLHPVTLPDGQKVRGRYEPRPFMGPALEANQQDIMDLFKQEGLRR